MNRFGVVTCAALAGFGVAFPDVASAQGLDASTVAEALERDARLQGKTFGRVVFYVADETGATVAIETLPMDIPLESSDTFERLSVPQNDQAKTCKKLNLPVEQVSGSGTIVHWCEPSTSMLQWDVFQKKLNGSKGSYFISFINEPCKINNKQNPDVPDEVYARFC